MVGGGGHNLVGSQDHPVGNVHSRQPKPPEGRVLGQSNQEKGAQAELGGGRVGAPRATKERAVESLLHRVAPGLQAQLEDAPAGNKPCRRGAGGNPGQREPQGDDPARASSLVPFTARPATPMRKQRPIISWFLELAFRRG